MSLLYLERCFYNSKVRLNETLALKKAFPGFELPFSGRVRHGATNAKKSNKRLWVEHKYWVGYVD